MSFSDCRICLLPFQGKMLKMRINEHVENKFFTITQTQLSKNPTLSQYLCAKCLDSLKEFCRYKEDLIENQMKLFMTETLDDQDQPSETEQDLKIQEEVVEVYENVEEYEKTLKVEKLENEGDIEEIKIELLEQGIDLVQESQDIEEEVLEEILEEVEYMEGESSEMGDLNVMDFQMYDAQFQQEIFETEDVEYQCIVQNEAPRKSLNRSRAEKMTPEERKERRKFLRKATTVCEECGKAINKSDFKRHYERMHLKLKNYECDFCGYRCYLKNHMQTHMVKHTQIKNFECSDCGKYFATRSQVNLHKVSIHSEERPFVCFEYGCGKTFKLKGALDKHVKYTHTKELVWPSWKCELCGAKFNCQKKLTEHTTIHEGKPGLSCDICGKPFFVNRQLRQHKVRVHEAPKFSCEMCPKKFYFNSDLSDHVKTHTGERNYACQYCDLKYFKRPHLHRHIKNHHMKLKFHCQVENCPSTFARKETYRSHVMTHHKDLGQENLHVLLERIKQERLTVSVLDNDPEIVII